MKSPHPSRRSLKWRQPIVRSFAFVVVAMFITLPLVPTPWLSALIYQVRPVDSDNGSRIKLELRLGSYARQSPDEPVLGSALKAQAQSIGLFRAEGFSRDPILTAVIYPLEQDELPSLPPSTSPLTTRHFRWGDALVLRDGTDGKQVTAHAPASSLRVWLPKWKLLIATNSIDYLEDILSIERLD